jgi:Salmonella virulence plasmid 65kDa B protein
MQAQPTTFASIATSKSAGLNTRFSRLVMTASLIGKFALGLGLALSLSTQAQTIVPGKIPGSFAVSPSGAATYSIPIQVPPGVAGMEPKLSLEYNSQGGNGIMGMGWNLAGLSSITRCPATMAQDGVRGSVNYDDKDKFCLDGQRLMVVSGAYGAPGSEYRTEIESFSRITAIGQAGTGPASFTVKTKAGLTMEYGIIDGTRDSRIEAQGKSAVMVWAIGKIADVKGNTMTFVYNEVKWTPKSRQT